MHDDAPHTFPSIPPQKPVSVDPIQPQTQTVVSGTPTYHKSPPSLKSRFLKIILIFVSLCTTALGTGALVAYGKIPVSEDLKNKVAHVIFQIPFFTPTKEYIVGRSYVVQENIQSLEYDSRFALQGVNFSQLPLSVPLELTIKGAYDSHDSENNRSKAHIEFSNQFGFDYVSLSNKSYYRITTVPTLLLSFLPISQTDLQTLTNIWVYNDIPELELDLKNDDLIFEEEEASLNEKTIEFIKKLTQEEILPKTERYDDIVDKHDTHKLVTTYTREELQSLLNKFADFVEESEKEKYSDNEALKPFQQEDVTLPEELKTTQTSLWIDKETFYIRKLEIISTFTQPLANDQSTNPYVNFFKYDDEVKVKFSIIFDKHNEQIEIEEPSETITSSEFVERLRKVINQNDGVTTRVEFETIKSDIELLGVSTDLYYATERRYPRNVEEFNSSRFSNIQIKEKIRTGKIEYLVSPVSSTVVIYSQIKDPSNSFRPYFVTVVSQNSDFVRESRNMTQLELTELLESANINQDLNTDENSSFPALAPLGLIGNTTLR